MTEVSHKQLVCFDLDQNEPLAGPARPDEPSSPAPQSLKQPRLQTDAARMFPQDPWSPLSPCFTATSQSVIFIGSVGASVTALVAASGKGSGLLRVFGVVQKLLLSQRRDEQTK